MESNYISLYDIFISLVWLIIFLVIANSKAKKVDESIRKYYLRNVLFKFFFGISFALIYLLYYGAGDTTAYWDGAITLNNLFWDSPVKYFEQLLGSNDFIRGSGYFNIETGYPPGWLTRESEAWFICKLTSIISFFSFRSYLAATLIMSFFTAMASWRVFELKNS